MISGETIDRIKEVVEITDVIGDYVALKKRGANYQACCPFHDEKTPSFNVNPARQIYKCFGCGVTGDAIQFVREIDGVGYEEALKYLAAKYQIEITETAQSSEDTIRQNEKESLYIALRFAGDYFQRQLTATDEGRSIGLTYFRERGLSDVIIEKFQLGYSPDQWDAFSNYALEQGYNAEILENAGLSVRREETGRLFDRFRGRVMFPIHNVSGKVIAFGGRILKADKKSAKYINSPETAVYHKSQILYGINQAKNAIRQQNLCYLVEGYTDVLSLYQSGIENVVASSGTALTTDQIRLIRRFTNHITILYDGDPAGIKAALRGLDLVLEEGMQVKVVTFPDNNDPDSYIKQVGGERFSAYLKETARDFISFKTDILLADTGNDPFKKAEIINDIVDSIIRIPDPIQRQVFFARVADQMRIDEQTLITQGNKLIRARLAQKQAEKQRESAQRVGSRLEQAQETESDILSIDVPPPVRDLTEQSRELIEEECVRLLVLYGNEKIDEENTVCQYILQEVEGSNFHNATFQLILETFRNNNDRIPDSNFFVNHPDPGIRKAAINWTTPRYQVSPHWILHEIYVPSELDVLPKSSMQSMFRLMKHALDEELKEIIKLMTDEEDEEAGIQLQNRYMKVKQKSILVSRELGIIFG